jgi:hypothetical protein
MQAASSMYQPSHMLPAAWKANPALLSGRKAPKIGKEPAAAHKMPWMTRAVLSLLPVALLNPLSSQPDRLMCPPPLRDELLPPLLRI